MHYIIISPTKACFCVSEQKCFTNSCTFLKTQFIQEVLLLRPRSNLTREHVPNESQLCDLRLKYEHIIFTATFVH